jgi:hypothetical protein
MPPTPDGVYDVLLWVIPALLWVVFWVWAVDWRKLWPLLGQGGWAPLVLLMVAVALAWSQLDPSTSVRLGFPVPNFWWQLAVVAFLVATALFCGWLQGSFGWAPPEVELEPPGAPGQHHAHGHGHH